MLLANKVAIITGASRGIGASAAHAFARAGASVVLAARDKAALDRVAAEISEAGAVAVAVPTDVTDEQAVQRLVETTVERFGGIHAAFNNAGGIPGGLEGRKALTEQADAEFGAVLDANLRGTWFCLKHQIPALVASGGGAIVNTSSTAGLSGGAPGIAAYVSAKHGLHGLTQNAALEFAAKGVRINAIALGPIRNDRYENAPEEFKHAAAQTIPMRRVGEPREAANAAVWLCSDESSFITGVVLPVDGGKTAGRA